MKQFIIVFILAVVLFSCSDKQKITPITNDGEKWRIGYYEGGPYEDYQRYFIALVEGLMTIGWIPKTEFPKLSSNDNNKDLWDFLSSVDSKYIEFVKEAYWSSDWYEEKRKENKLDIIVYLQQRKLDLIIAAGTWAGLDLANNYHRVPVIIISSSDPIRSKIIKSAKDSGFNHVFASCDPLQYVKQIRVFHNIVRFDKLGIVYEDTEDGKVWASLEDAKAVAKEKDFEIVTCIASDSNHPIETSMKLMYKCFEELAPKIDAIYIGAHRGTNNRFMPKVLKPLFDKNIPTFAQEGPDQVKRGVLFSVARSDLVARGLFNAKTIAKIFNGISPRKINQVYPEEKKIILNLETAKRINFKIPKAIIDAADTIYEIIEK